MTNFNYVFDWTTWFNDPGTSNTIAEQAFDPLNPTAITVTPTTIQGAGAGVAPNAPTDSIEIGAFVETDFDNNGNQITVTPTAPSGSNPPTGVSDTQFGADTGFLRFAIDGPSGQGTAREQAAINLLFNNTDANGSPGVSNLSFNLLDIDNSAFFRDQVRVEVFDTDGNLVPVGLVNLTPVDPSRFAIDSSNDQITATAGSDVPLDQPTGNVLVSVDGSVQVGRVRIVYTSAQPGSNPNSNTFYQTIGIGDLNYTADIDVGIYDDTDPGAPSAGIDDGTVFGTADNDVIFGGLQARGDPGALNDDTNPNDTIEGRDGDDTLYAGIGFDTLYGGADDDTLFAGENDDTLYGGDGNDTLEGEAGNDTLFGDGGNDTLFGGAGGDLLYGGIGNDSLSGGGGTDTLYGDVGNDTLSGGSSNDTLFGGGGSDALRGNDGVDILFGGDGLDFIEGGAGSDTLVGGIGLDFLFGGTGSDVVSLLPNEGTDTIIGGEDVGDGDIDVLRSDGSEGLSVVFTAAEAGSATVTGTTATFSQIERVELTDFGDTVDGSASVEALSIEGLGGNDTITGGSDGDQLYGGDDDDALYGGPGDDTLYGGSDDDELFGGAGADTLYGDAGNDAITVDGSDSAFGGLNSDEFTVGATDGSPIFIDGDEDPDDSDIDTLDIRGLTAANGQPLRRSDITFVPGTGEEDGSFVLQDGTVVTFQNIEAIICFAAGTMIRTPEGERAVETLAEGDLVVTRDGTAKPIRWTGRRTVPAEGRLAPIAIAAGALGNAEALRVSPMHRMLLTDWRAEILFGSAEVLVAAKHLVNGDTIRQVPGGTVDYVHILFDRHEIVFANGALSESFHPGHVGLDALEDEAREELLTLFPELREDAAAYGPTALPSLKAYEARALIG